MKICLVSAQYPPESGLGGGIGTTVRLLAEGLASLGHAVHVISAAPGSSPERTSTVCGVVVHRIKAIGESLRGYWRLERLLEGFLPLHQLCYAWRVRQKLQQLIAEEAIELVMSPEWGAETLFFALTTRLAPLIVTLRGATYLRRRYDGRRDLSSLVLHFLERLLVRRADRLAAVSHTMARAAAEAYGVDAGRIAVIHNEVDLARFSPNAHVASPNEPSTVLYVGRLERLKGVEALARAVPLVLQRVPEVRFEFIGRDRRWNGSAELTSSYLKRLIGPHALERVTFHDAVPQDQLARCYQRGTVCVFSSLFEPFGNVVAEAMACGKPVVTTNTTGVSETIEEGKDGFIVPPDDPQALACTIITLLENPTLRKQVGRSAHAKVEARCHPSQYLARHIELFEQAVPDHMPKRGRS